MDRKAYNDCMRPHMTGSKTREQRQQDMCIGAKLCTGKASTREEAQFICSQPKPASTKIKTKGSKPQSCEKEVAKIAHCMVERIDMNLASNINSIEAALISAMVECQCPPTK